MRRLLTLRSQAGHGPIWLLAAALAMVSWLLSLTRSDDFIVMKEPNFSQSGSLTLLCNVVSFILCNLSRPFLSSQIRDVPSSVNKDASRLSGILSF